MDVKGFHIIKGFLFKSKLDAIDAKNRFVSPFVKYRIFKNRNGLYRVGCKETNKLHDFVLSIFGG